MTQVSRYPVSDRVYQRILEIFLKSLVKIETSDEANQFIKDFLSPVEQIMLAKRLAIAFLLEQNYEFREISKILRVSLATVARVSLMKKIGGVGYQKIIHKLMNEEQLKEFLRNIAETLTGLVSRGKGSNTWRYLHDELKYKKKQKPF